MLALVVDEETGCVVSISLVRLRHLAELVVDRDLSVEGAASLHQAHNQRVADI